MAENLTVFRCILTTKLSVKMLRAELYTNTSPSSLSSSAFSAFRLFSLGLTDCCVLQFHVRMGKLYIAME